MRLPIWILLLSPLFSLHARLIVSELYRDPPGGEKVLGGGASHEFVELTNLGPDTVSVTDLYITNGIQSDSIIPEAVSIPGHENCRYNNRMIVPGMSALILDPDYRAQVTAYPDSRFTIPDSTLLLQCGDAQFGSSGLVADNGVCIYRGTRTQIDTVLCSAADQEVVLPSPTAGKITLSNPENLEGISLVATRILSTDPAFGYCGTGVSPGTFEPLAEGWVAEFHPGRFDRPSATVACTVSVLSTQATVNGPVAWQLTRRISGKESVVLSGMLTVTSREGTAVPAVPVDSAELIFTLQTGNHPSWTVDLSTVWLPEATLRITEIFPKTVSGEPEWFEVENHSAMTINLKNWRFGNGDDTATITETAFLLKPGDFAVITKDAAALAGRYPSIQRLIAPRHWVKLDNTRDTLMLFDAGGTLRETVCYDDAWFTDWPYAPIERNGGSEGCSNEVWSVTDRPSPGLPNQALYWRAIDKPSLDIGPIPFTPDNDGSNDLLAIRLKLPAGDNAAITVYSFDGRAVKTFTGPPHEVIYWDGRGTSGTVPPGPFFIVAEIRHGETTQRLRKKGILWRK